MPLPINSDTVTHGIQLAIAPVFLLTAVSGMIGAVASRLARIIDRARKVEERAAAGEESAIEPARVELRELRVRGRLCNWCIALLTLCGFLIGLTIMFIFLEETTKFQGNQYAVISFLAGVVSFLFALGCFLAETLIATRLLNFPLLKR